MYDWFEISFNQIELIIIIEFGLREKVPAGEYANSEDPDQTAQLRSLIRVFAVRSQNNWVPRIILDKH